jgi:hypothetical protein
MDVRRLKTLFQNVSSILTSGVPGYGLEAAQRPKNVLILSILDSYKPNDETDETDRTLDGTGDTLNRNVARGGSRKKTTHTKRSHFGLWRGPATL